LNLLIVAILAIGATLMYNSIFILTKNPFISILSISISEAGLVGWEIARERVKNTEKQTQISSAMRWYHVITSVTLLTINFIVETATLALSVKIDGLVYIIFGIVGFTALLDLIAFFIYGDADRDSTNKKEFSKKIEILKSQTISKKLDAYAKSEEIRANALVRYWENNSSDLAELTGKIQAAAQIKNEFLKSGLSEHEIDSVLQKITRKSLPNVQQLLPNTNVEETKQQPAQKRKYTKRVTPESEQKEKNKVGDLVSQLEDKSLLIPVVVEDKKETLPFQESLEDQQEADW
jgi:hypothetical protein